MTLTLGQLAERIGAELIGDAAAEVRRARPVELAAAGDVTFAESDAYRQRALDSPATAVILAAPAEAPGRNLLLAQRPKLAFARAVQALHAAPYEPRGVSEDFRCGEGTALGRDLSIHPRVTVGRDCRIGDRVTLHPGVVVGDRCRIGEDTVIYPNVTLYDDCEIGARVIIHAGTVIGADGFGFVADEQGRQVKILQLGRVIVEDDCEIGANCAIDRGAFEATVLRRGVKLDNFIQVGHHTELGEDTVVAAQTGFSGGTRVGRGCVIAAQVGTNQHITIGDRAVIMGAAAVTKSVPPGARMAGMVPAYDYNRWRRSQVLYSQLPELAERLRRLEQLVRESRAGREAATDGE